MKKIISIALLTATITIHAQSYNPRDASIIFIKSGGSQEQPLDHLIMNNLHILTPDTIKVIFTDSLGIEETIFYKRID